MASAPRALAGHDQVDRLHPVRRGAHLAAPHDQRVVEQRAVAFRDGVERARAATRTASRTSCRWPAARVASSPVVRDRVVALRGADPAVHDAAEAAADSCTLATRVMSHASACATMSIIAVASAREVRVVFAAHDRRRRRGRSGACSRRWSVGATSRRSIARSPVRCASIFRYSSEPTRVRSRPTCAISSSSCALLARVPSRLPSAASGSERRPEQAVERRLRVGLRVDRLVVTLVDHAVHAVRARRTARPARRAVARLLHRVGRPRAVRAVPAPYACATI